MLLLISNFGHLPYYLRNIFFSWEVLLIAIGLINVVSRESKTLGLILISVGGFFLLDDIFVFAFDFYKLFWPVLLIVIGGTLILFGGKVFNHRRFHGQYSSSTEDGVVNEVNVFGGNKKRIVSSSFKGGEIINIFGGSEIDLTQSELAEGRNVLELICIFGGSTIVVPSDWNVRTEIVSILGGFGDKRTIVKKPIDESKQLIIKGVAIFGGGEIKSY